MGDTRRIGVRSRRVDPVLVAALVVVAVPIVVAAARAVADHWIPIGDDALVAIRARDVFTVDHPLLGTWTSASIDAGVQMNHPGPLLFDALALPVRLFGGHAGVALGVMVVNLLAAWTVVGVAWRRAARVGAVAGAAAVTFLAWTMGSQLLFDPWNPHVLILACLALLACAWSLGCGGWRALPVYMTIGSFCVQTHLGYVYLVPGVLAVAVVVGALLRRSVPVTEGPPARPLPTRGVVLATVAVTAVLWAQPFWEQLFGSGEGNLARLAGAAGSSGPTVGASLAVRILGAVVAVPPWGARAAFADAVPITPYTASGALAAVDTTSLAAAVAGLLVVAAVIAAALWFAVRRRDRVALAALGVSVGALLVAFVTIAIMPIGPLGLTPHQMRWMWAMGAFLWFSLLVTIGRGLNAVAHQRIGLAVAGALTVLFALLTLPTFVQPAGPAAFAFEIPTVSRLDDQLVGTHLATVWFDSSNTPLLDNYSAAVLAQLQADGVTFRVDDPGLVRQFGDHRWLHGDADARLYLLYGRDAMVVPDGDRRIALATPLSADEQAELLADEQLLVAFASTGAAVLDDGGVAAAGAGTLPVDPASLDTAVVDPLGVVTSGVLPALLRDGFVDADDATVAAATRYAALLTAVNAQTTVAVIVGPLPG